MRHPRPIRWLHWLNIPLLTLLIWSGIRIYWANDVYIPIPRGIGQTLHLDHRLARGMAWHFFLMWPFILNGLIYVSFLALSGEWKNLALNRRTLLDAWKVALHDLGISKSAPPTEGMYNAAQRTAYVSAIAFGAGSAITGIAIYKPVRFVWITQVLGGYETARFLHFAFMLGLISFAFVHIVQVIRAGWTNLRGMISGEETQNDQHSA